MPIIINLIGTISSIGLLIAVSGNHPSRTAYQALGRHPLHSANSQSMTLRSRYAVAKIDTKGYLISLTSIATGKQYCPPAHPSPLLSLHQFGRPNSELVFPLTATFDDQRTIRLRYPTGAVAVVKAESEDSYFRFRLISLTHRDSIDNVIWGPVHTTISKTIGDLIGVVRDDHWAIGLLGLTDNTIAGPPTDSDCYGMGYYIHVSDPAKYPLPAKYREGQWFNIGGDGVSDVAFYSHPEEYFRQVFGNGAKLEPSFGSTLAYHSRDRRRSYTYLFSLLPGFQGSRPRHQISDPMDADYLGSAIALYACPDHEGLATIEHIEKREGLPHPVIDGKWVHDPSGFKPDIAWFGPHDKLIEYADALGLKAVQDEEQGEYYANPADHWLGPRVKFAHKPSQTYRQFTDQTNRQGIKYGLHTLCLFLQARRCTDVSPNANEDLQTVLRTRLAQPISASDDQIEVTSLSFLGEDGTWPMRDGSNVLRIGSELVAYKDVSPSAPFFLRGVKRGFDGAVAAAHPADSEVAKLQMNCYDGFCPDMKLMPAYADYYANVMAENGMKYVDFDGLESTLYQNQGYYGVRRFFRRLFETYAKRTGGEAPRIMGSCVFAGGWEYMSVCNVGGDERMFDPVTNRWGIEGKDIRYGFASSYFPATFGIQNYRSDWSLYDAENLEAKSLGWDATFMLGLSQDAVEKSGEKAQIFKAIRTWERARSAGVFTPTVKGQLKDLGLKFHLRQMGDGSFVLYPIQEIRASLPESNSTRSISLSNPEAAQPFKLSVRFSAPATGIRISLPNGGEIRCDQKIDAGEFIECDEGLAYLEDASRSSIVRLPVSGSTVLPHGASTLKVRILDGASSRSSIGVTVWAIGKGERLLVPRAWRPPL